ncbi:MAG TPA: mannitol dehydrogenase family protein, partial [Acidimicrobiia bacterium]|nr:mannitol dehydrogenase family protein [Acidimicrobiia bacterium]
RAALTRGVVHISVGAFHRSHQAVYFDELARRGLGDGWAVTGVGLYRPELKRALDPQDGLYTVVSRGPAGDSARVVGVLTRYLYAPEDREAVLCTLADRRTRLVTLTITAGGYLVDLETGAFDGDAPDVVHDLANPHQPCSALGLLVEALDRRRRRGLPPFTVLSCDNLTANGAVARTAVVSMAAQRDHDLAAWVDERGSFPDSMVDRITPGTTDADRAMVERTFGVRDRWPVMTEPFTQWVIEDRFADGRPPLEEVGAQFVSDVTPYALTKTRLLNASHVALGHVGSLAGNSRLDETIADPVFAHYVQAMMDEEISPLLPPVGIDLPDYTARLRERFGNPQIADPLVRLCRNGSTKVAAHLLPSIREARALGRPCGLLTLAIAAWCRYLRGVDERGRRIPIADEADERLRTLARRGGDGERYLLAHEPTFGSLARCPEFTAAVSRDLRELDADGVRAVLSRRTSSHAVGAAR